MWKASDSGTFLWSHSVMVKNWFPDPKFYMDCLWLSHRFSFVCSVITDLEDMTSVSKLTLSFVLQPPGPKIIESQPEKCTPDSELEPLTGCYSFWRKVNPWSNTSRYICSVLTGFSYISLLVPQLHFDAHLRDLSVLINVIITYHCIQTAAVSTSDAYESAHILAEAATECWGRIQ